MTISEKKMEPGTLDKLNTSHKIFDNRQGVRKRILIPLTIIFVILCSSISIFFYYLGEWQMGKDARAVAEYCFKDFNEELDHHVLSMQGLLMAISQNQEIKNHFHGHDRNLLYKTVQGLFKQIKQDFDITHLYFHKPDRTCFLRVHHSSRYGDTINRYTAINAQKSGQISFGMELGPFGTFTLRVVFPWFEDGQIIGYIEAGKEVEHLIRHIQQTNDGEFFVNIEKRNLKKKSFEDGLKFLGRKAEWDLSEAYVTTFQTLQNIPAYLKKRLYTPKYPAEEISFSNEYGEKKYYYSSSFNLKDAGERIVGSLTILLDFNSRKELNHNQVQTIVAVNILGFCLLFIMFYRYLGSIDFEIKKQKADTAKANLKLIENERAYRSIMEERIERRTRALKEANGRLLSILETTNQGFWLIDKNTKIIEINPTMARILNRPKNKILGRSIFDFSDQANKEIFANQLHSRQAGASGSYDISLVRPGGGQIPCHFNATPLFNGSGDLIGSFAMVTDITEQKQFEKQLKEAKSKAEQANRAKSTFLASMSHELRTPLNSILGFAQLLEEKYHDKNNPECVNWITNVIKSGNHLLELINEVLDLAKIESGEMQLSLEPVELCDVVLDTLEVVRPLSQQNAVTLIPEPPEYPIYIRADRMKLSQVVMNLLSNAIKYNRPEGSVKISSSVSKNRIRLHVTDTGYGIDDEKLNSIFDPFNRLGAEFSTIEGSGIGLTITKRLVEMMGGEIGVESQDGVGTTFFVEFERSEHQANQGWQIDSTKDRRTDIRQSRPLDGPKTILYVEDNQVNLKLVETILSDISNISLIFAQTGKEGILMAKENRPDMVLLDINLPDMNGFEVYQALEQIDGTYYCPVVGLSANAMPVDIKMALDTGFSAYITKPIHIGKFRDTIIDILRKYDSLPNRKDKDR